MVVMETEEVVVATGMEATTLCTTWLKMLKGKTSSQETPASKCLYYVSVAHANGHVDVF